MRSVASTFTCTSCIPLNRNVLLSTSGCLSEGLCLWKTVFLLKGLFVPLKDCLSRERTACLLEGLSVGRTFCLSEGLSVCLSKGLAPYLKDFLWRTLCLSLRLLEGFSVYPKNCLPLWRTVCLSLYLRRLSVFTVFFCLSIHLSLPVCLSIVLSSSVCLY